MTEEGQSRSLCSSQEMALLVMPVLGKGNLIGAAEPSGPPPAQSRPERRLSGQREDRKGTGEARSRGTRDPQRRPYL